MNTLTKPAITAKPAHEKASRIQGVSRLFAAAMVSMGLLAAPVNAQADSADVATGVALGAIAGLVLFGGHNNERVVKSTTVHHGARHRDRHYRDDYYDDEIEIRSSTVIRRGDRYRDRYHDRYHRRDRYHNHPHSHGYHRDTYYSGPRYRAIGPAVRHRDDSVTVIRGGSGYDRGHRSDDTRVRRHHRVDQQRTHRVREHF